MTEPTGDQCTHNERLQLDDGRTAIATWYPSMGGYVGKCLITQNPGEDCFEVAVWHDGEFPFRGEDGPPTLLHHCQPEDFIQFGELMRTFGEES